MATEKSPKSIQGDQPDACPAWGPWTTAVLGVFIALAFFVAPTVLGLVVATGLNFLHGSSAHETLWFRENNGLFISISSILSALLGCLLIFVAVSMRRHLCPGVTVRKYLHLESRGSVRAVLIWITPLALYLLAMDGLNLLLDRPIVPEFAVRAYQTAGFVPLLWLAMVVAAPVFEEALFRGFLLEGYRRTKRQTLLAVVIISAVWAGFHLQYGLYEMAWIFGLGLMLSAARLQSDSLWPPLLLHALCNLAATVETAVVASQAN